MGERQTMLCIDKDRQAALSAMAGVVLLCCLLFLAGCGQAADNQSDRFTGDLITAESLEGLILEGEGPIPARLIYRSRNTISSEEDRLVLETISLELDRLVELAGRLDAAITEETARAEEMEASLALIVEDEGSAALFAQVRYRRQAFLETRMDVVRQANEARQRVADMLLGEKPNVQTAEALRKDLEAIREDQRIVTTVLSDIVNAAASNADTMLSGMSAFSDSDAIDEEAWPPEEDGQRENQGEIASALAYIESLIVLYQEKAAQLARVAESLSSVAVGFA